MKNEIAVIYDEECPICNHFACAINDSNAHINVINGREDSVLLKKAYEHNLDIDRGSIVYTNDQFYYGADAFHLVANNSNAKGMLGFLNRFLFRHKPIAIAVYPVLVFTRKILLKVIGVPPIGERADRVKAFAVYYNSACPVCDAGIKYQKSKMKECKISWKDIHIDHSARSDLISETEFIRKRLHVLLENGEVKIGIYAFIALWEASPRERWKANLFKFPVIHQASLLGYNSFAWCLYNWNKLLGHW